MPFPFAKLGAEIWRDFVTDSVPASGANKPDKADMRAWMGVVEPPITLATGPAGPGLEPKASVAAATTTNITLSGTQTIDGVSVVATNRVLVKDQSAPAENGIWVCAAGAWARATDMDAWAEVPRALVPVLAGTVNANTTWVSTNGTGGTIGTTAITFTRIPIAAPVVYPSAWAGPYSQQLVHNDSGSSAKAANKAAIQAVIDYAYTNGLQTINISAGIFYCDPGIYLDAPNNLRNSLTVPTIFNFSLALVGAGGPGNHEGHGTQLRWTDNTTNALIVGTGQGMTVRGLSVLGPTGATSRKALPANGKGILIAGGSGGSTRTLLENVMVENFSTGVDQGSNNAALADAVTLRKCHLANCFRGHAINGTQNYINSHEECVFSNNTTHIYSPVGKPVNIRGGNYSATDAKKNAFTIGSTSVLSSFSDSFPAGGAAFTNWTFTTTLSADDQPMIDGAYDAFAIKTTGFGVIPLQLTNYNSGSKVATLKFYVGWLTAHYRSFDMKANTDIEAELAAATKLYACEMVTPFFGTGINADGVHVENPQVLTKLLTTESSVQGDRVSRISKLFANYYINHADIAGGTDAQKAVFYCQQVFPFIRVVSADAVLENCMLVVDPHVGLGKDGINIEILGNQFANRFISRNNDLFHPNITLTLWSPFSADNDFNWPTMVRGAGEWDSSPFLPGAETLTYYAANRVSNVPFLGWSPAPWTHPRIKRSVLDAIAAGPGALGSYPSLHGQTIYSILDDGSGSDFEPIGPLATLMARSCHQHFSYGQNLTINWSYKGKTSVVTLSDMTRMYAGLKIVLDNGGGDTGYIVTGVYPTLGYVTVIKLNQPDGLLDGTKTVTYNAATVKQQAYSIARSGVLAASKAVTNSNAGAQTAAVGDLTGAAFVNLLLTAIGAANFTTRTATQMFGDIPGAYVGLSFMLSIKNTNAGTTTLVAGTGVTITGTATIAQNTARLFDVTFPTATTCTITSRGVTATV
jgi:hypothetical protein